MFTNTHKQKTNYMDMNIIIRNLTSNAALIVCKTLNIAYIPS